MRVLGLVRQAFCIAAIEQIIRSLNLENVFKPMLDGPRISPKDNC